MKLMSNKSPQLFDFCFEFLRRHRPETFGEKPGVCALFYCDQIHVFQFEPVRAGPELGDEHLGTRVVVAPLEPERYRDALADAAAGGYSSFEGWVRDHNDGKRVRRLEYEAFESLALKEGARIVQEAQAKRYIVDTVETTFPILKVMHEYKLLAPYASAYLAAYPDEVKEPAGKGLVYWATDRESYIGLAYNTNSIQGNAVPKGFDDLLPPFHDFLTWFHSVPSVSSFGGNYRAGP